MKFTFLLIIVLCLHSLYSSAQKPDVALNEFNQKYPQEKIHFHFDKEMYVAGETIWFKAYLIAEFLRDNISTSLFIKMFDANGKLISEKNLPILEGTASGNFDLPDSLPGGYYTIQAYTPWMLNFDKDFLYTKKLYVFNTVEGMNATSKNENYTVNFFPEGGNMIADVVNFVAFKATDANGYPVSFTGSITDSKGNTITEIKTIHDGMGRFTLLPQADEKYFSKLKFANGKGATVQLPSSIPHGIAMHVDKDATQIQVTLSRSTDDAKEKKTLFILGQIENHTVFKANITMQGESLNIPVSYNNFPSGILQITIFDSLGRPLLERLTFVNNGEYTINSTLTADTFNLTKRAKNVFTFSVPDSLEGNYSIAITDDDKTIMGDDRDNIISQFLLSSDIKGYVHDPAFYFSNTDKLTKDALELVMMTNGWRRFVWEQILNNQFPEVKFKSLPYISIRGKVFAENKKDLITEGDLNFFIKAKADSIAGFFTVPVNSTGVFKIDSLVFTDTANFVYNYNIKKKNRKLVYLQLDQNSPWPGGTFFNPPVYNFYTDDSLVNSFKVKMHSNKEQLEFYNDYVSKIIQLKEIKINAKKKTPVQLVNERYTSSIFSTMNGKVIDLINNPPPYTTSLETYIRNQIPAIDVTGPPGQRIIVSVFGGQSIMRGKLPISVFLDEMEMDFNDVAYTPIDEIALIKYVSSFVMSEGNRPALFIYRKLARDMAGNSANYVGGFSFPGYSVTKEFYSPDYSKPDEKASAPDTRITLYWNPQILLDSDKQKETFKFYNSDNCQKMRVIIEGFNAAGKLCRIEKVFEK